MILAPLHEYNLFKMDFPKTNETVTCLAISRHERWPTYKFEGVGDNAWRIIHKPLTVSSDSHPVTPRTCLYV